MSLTGALTPLGKVANRWGTWVGAVSLYTLTGLGVSGALGAGLGELGHLLGLGAVQRVVLTGALLAALALAAREIGVVRFPLPERRRQTEKAWMPAFGPLWAAALWGLHLGPGLFTRINYGGFWVIAVLALGLGDVRLGVLMMGGHWLGKALSVWVAPLVVRNPDSGDELLAVWGSETARYRRVQATGLVATAIVVGAWLVALPGGS